MRSVARCAAAAAVLAVGIAAPVHAAVLTTTTVSSSASEGGAPATYWIELSSAPSEPVNVHVDTGSQLASVAPLLFTPDDWNTPQQVDVYAVDDFIDEPTASVNVRHQVTTTDGATIVEPWGAHVAVEILDNDTSGVLVSPVGLSANEGDTVTWRVSLTSEPTSTVTLTFGDDGTDANVQLTTITFTPSDWSIPQPVSVDIVDDFRVEGTHVTEITTTVSSNDPLYAAVSVPSQPVTVSDDDRAGIVLRPAPPETLTVTEGMSSKTYFIRLSSEPTAYVEIDLASLNGQVVADPPMLTFTPTDWSAERMVTVTAIDDTYPETSPAGDAILHTANSLDDHYATPTLPDMALEVVDDDSPAILVDDPADMTLDEGDPAGTERTLSIRMATPPVGEVAITAISDGQVMLLSTNRLTFDATNWNVVQQLRVQAATDDVAEPEVHQGMLSFTVATNDPDYSGMTVAPRYFQISDDDIANAQIQCIDGPDWARDATGSVLTSEDPDAATHDVGCYLQLGTPAASDVTFSIATTPGDQVAVDRPTVVIPAGQLGPELVTFTATDDAVAEPAPHGAAAEFTVSSADPVYGSMGIAPIQFAVHENDQAGVQVTPDGPIALTEGAAEGTASISLTSQPTSSLSISVAVDPQLQLVAPSGGLLLFTTTNWNVPQDIQVVAVNDSIAEASPLAAAVTLAISSSDPAYAALAAPAIPIELTDDDVPGLELIATGADTAVSEGGTPDTVGVRLTTEPVDTVTVTVATQVDQLTATPGTLTFTQASWNTPQDVSVTAVQDTVYEAAHTGTLAFTVASADPSYDAGGPATLPGVTVSIADDEQGGATVVESDGSTGVTEAGGTDTYTVVLNAQPTADVVIRPAGGDQVTVTPSALTFTAASWSTPQTVTITAVQDEVDEADPHTVEVTHAIESSAAGWSGAIVSNVNAKITDDDTATIVVEQTEGTTRVMEGAKQGDEISFKLTSRPVADVSITPTGDAQLSVPTTPIVLTPAAWQTPVKLTVQARNDSDREKDHTGKLTFAVASTDPTYAKAVVADITVAIVDDDTDVTIMPGDDGGDIEEDEEPTRDTREDGDGESTKGSSGRDDGQTGESTRRSEDGAQRTDEGAERTDAGLGLTTSGSGRKRKRDKAKEEPELDGEIVSATERAPKPKRKPKPNPILQPVTKAAAWVSDNWETVAPIAGAALMAASAGTFLLRGDPIKAAQRGLSSRVPLDRGSGSSDTRKARKPGRPRRKKRKHKQAPEQQPDAAGPDPTIDDVVDTDS